MESNKRNNEFIDDNDYNDKNKKKKIDTSSNNEDKNENKSNIDLENQENVNKNTYIDFDDDYKQIEGICCYCGYECNILSQSCGKCAREYTMRMFNWK